MDDLIRQLEEATEGSRELDCDVARAFGYTPPSHPNSSVWIRPDGKTAFHVNNLPYWTTSLDAALTLLGRDWKWLVEVWQDDTGWAQVVTDKHLFYGAEAATPSLALCIAALRARKEEQE